MLFTILSIANILPLNQKVFLYLKVDFSLKYLFKILKFRWLIYFTYIYLLNVLIDVILLSSK
jgi:hypothetical protein